MERQMTLKLSDLAYEWLCKESRKTGETPEEIATDTLNATLESLAKDPLINFEAIDAAPVADAADQHDAYLGQALYEEVRDPPDA